MLTSGPVASVHGYTYVEVSDGDELLENRTFSDIHTAHLNIFDLLKGFHREGRLHLIYGNHDLARANPAVVAQELHWTTDETTGKREPFLPGIEVHEGLVFRLRTDRIPHPDPRGDTTSGPVLCRAELAVQIQVHLTRWGGRRCGICSKPFANAFKK